MSDENALQDRSVNSEKTEFWVYILTILIHDFYANKSSHDINDTEQSKNNRTACVSILIIIPTSMLLRTNLHVKPVHSAVYFNPQKSFCNTPESF